MPINQLTEDGFGMLVGSSGSEPFSFGNALQFDGTDDYVNFSSLPKTSSNLTVSFWLKVLSNSSTPNGIIKSQDGNNQLYDWIIGIQNGKIIVYNWRSAGSPLNKYTYSTVLTLNSWFHVGFVWDGTTNIIFLNGISDAISATTTTGSGWLAGNYFGTSYLPSSNYFANIQLDEIAMWNTALSSTDISNLYNSGNGDYATNYNSGNLVAYWRMNGSGTDTTAIDEQGNYNGTLNNFPTSGMWVAH